MEPALEPLVQAASMILRDCHERMRKVVQNAPLEALNWRPGPDTNSIYVILNHALNSEKTWLAHAVGEEFRDRPSRAAEFSVVADDPAVLLRRLDEADADAATYLAKLDSAYFTAEHRRAGGQPVTGAWAFLHALEHPQEHLAQMELTLQWWEQQGKPASS